MAAENTVRDDALTVAAIAILAMCVSTTAHEAIGHGGACLASGGRIAQLTSVYFQCAPGGQWIPAAGPAGNLVAAVLAGIGAKLTPAARPRLRLLLALVMAISLFWEAGYLLYAMARREGDWAIAAREVFGSLTPVVRIAGAAAGIGLYLLGARLVAGAVRPFGDRARRLLALAWTAAGVAACAAAAFYAPDRLDAMKQAALEVGAASLPLLIMRLRTGPAGEPAPRIARDWRWIAVSAAAYAGFILTLGRGLP